ncbi:hypothetical protein U9M48_009476 [Paspalum notatum var. saurae]|uniref:Transposase MuDR plant domain-containing protein n=1 Tax=Paspalum notatum var. saurae TaxID=547442 RepID=A0AAQ3SSL0_PASNO
MLIEDDEEVKQINEKFKEFKKQLKKGELHDLDDGIVYEINPVPGRREIEDAGQAEEEESLEDSDGNLTTQSSQYPRFNSNDPIPKFELGMKFRGKKQFKKAIIKHGMVERKLIKFYKNEATRMIAKCEWTTCAWRCMLSTNSRTSSWQISSFIQEHTCPPRRDNRLVTAKRVAEKYEKFILANPSWSLERMRRTIQEEMFADVGIPKLKRAKSIALDSTKGQYKHLYSYQEELLRSNPGSTVCDKEGYERCGPCVPEDVHMLGCLVREASRLAVERLLDLMDGATNGELLCAIGRDANNQMYPIAWAVVEKENNDVLLQLRGILKAVEKWAPNAEHRNLLGTYMPIGERSIRRRNGEALLQRPGLPNALHKEHKVSCKPIPKDWSGAWFRLGSNCDSVDNNMCESFNKWIVEARFYPIITMLEAIRRKVMVRIQQNRTKAESRNTLICPNILKKVNSYITLSSSCHAICNGQHRFEVQDFANRFTRLISKETSAHVDIGGYPDYLALMPSHASFTRQIH